MHLNTFTDDQILAQGATKCSGCQRSVSTIQVLIGTHRKWINVDWRRTYWVEHDCPAKKAASSGRIVYGGHSGDDP